MSVFGQPERKGGEERFDPCGHTLKPVWLRDMQTQDETILRASRQLRLMSVYGIGGCSVIQLSEDQMDEWFLFAKDMGRPTQGMHLLLAEAIPKAYGAVVYRKRDCREYFLGEHNDRVRATKTTASQIRLCLARTGEILDIVERNKAGRLLMTNTALLRSKTGKRLERIGVIGTEVGQAEHAFLDFVPGARIGDRTIIHRNIACETF
ncbi:Uncharacterised protein [uncultured archaeon]|nr:Uncharacterised protein [uncultured archaeon]